MSLVFNLKTINFLGKSTIIVCQNENGPCPLLAIANVLALQRKINLSSFNVTIKLDELTQIVAMQIIETMDAKSSNNSPNLEQTTLLESVLNILPKLAHGLDLNVFFTSVNKFEFTPEISVFDSLGIALLHGWLVDQKNDYNTYQVINNQSYNHLVMKLVEYKALTDRLPTNIQSIAHTLSPSESTTLREGKIVDDFLNSSATQLTQCGIYSLYSTMRDRELVVFFRNNHFSTLFSYNGQLFNLVTDAGYQHELSVVWEILDDIKGNSEYYNGSFEPLSAYQPNSNNFSYLPSPPPPTQQTTASSGNDRFYLGTISAPAPPSQQQQYQQQQSSQQFSQSQQHKYGTIVAPPMISTVAVPINNHQHQNFIGSSQSTPSATLNSTPTAGGSSTPHKTPQQQSSAAQQQQQLYNTLPPSPHSQQQVPPSPNVTRLMSWQEQQQSLMNNVQNVQLSSNSGHNSGNNSASNSFKLSSPIGGTVNNSNNNINNYERSLSHSGEQQQQQNQNVTVKTLTRGTSNNTSQKLSSSPQLSSPLQQQQLTISSSTSGKDMHHAPMLVPVRQSPLNRSGSDSNNSNKSQNNVNINKGISYDSNDGRENIVDTNTAPSALNSNTTSSAVGIAGFQNNVSDNNIIVTHSPRNNNTPQNNIIRNSNSHNNRSGIFTPQDSTDQEEKKEDNVGASSAAFGYNSNKNIPAVHHAVPVEEEPDSDYLLALQLQEQLNSGIVYDTPNAFKLGAGIDNSAAAYNRSKPQASPRRNNNNSGNNNSGVNSNNNEPHTSVEEVGRTLVTVDNFSQADMERELAEIRNRHANGQNHISVADFQSDYDTTNFSTGGGYQQPNYTTGSSDHSQNQQHNQQSQLYHDTGRIMDNTDNYQAPDQDQDDFAFMSQEERDAQTAMYLQFQEDVAGGKSGGRKQRGRGNKKDCVIQ